MRSNLWWNYSAETRLEERSVKLDMRNLSVVVGKSWSSREKIDSCKALTRRGRYSFPGREEDHHRVDSNDGHCIGEDGQAEFGNVARLSIFTNDLIKEIGPLSLHEESRLYPVHLHAVFALVSSTEIWVTWSWIPREKRNKKIKKNLSLHFRRLMIGGIEAQQQPTIRW